MPDVLRVTIALVQPCCSAATATSGGLGAAAPGGCVCDEMTDSVGVTANRAEPSASRDAGVRLYPSACGDSSVTSSPAAAYQPRAWHAWSEQLLEKEERAGCSPVAQASTTRLSDVKARVRRIGRPVQRDHDGLHGASEGEDNGKTAPRCLGRGTHTHLHVAAAAQHTTDYKRPQRGTVVRRTTEASFRFDLKRILDFSGTVSLTRLGGAK